MKKKLSFISIIGILALLISTLFINPSDKTMVTKSLIRQDVDQNSLVQEITNAKKDYLTTTIIELVSENGIINIDSSIAKDGITIQSGQNIVFRAKEKEVTIGKEYLGVTLNISVPFKLDKQSTVTFENDVVLKSGGSITASATTGNEADNDFNAKINFNNSLTLEDNTEINSRYFNQFNIFGGLNAYDKENTENTDIKIVSDKITPIDFNTSNTIAILIGNNNVFPIVEGKFVGDFAVISNGGSYSAQSNGLTGFYDNTFKLQTKDVKPSQLDKYILVEDTVLHDNVTANGTLISYQDKIVSLYDGNKFNSILVNNDVFNLNGIVGNNGKRYCTSNKLILDGGAKYVKEPNNNQELGVWFVDGEQDGNIKRNVYKNTNKVKTISNNNPAIVNVTQNATLNIFNETIIQNNQVNANKSENDKAPFGGGISVFASSGSKPTLNMYGGKIQFNSVIKAKNSIGGAGIGATTDTAGNKDVLDKDLNVNIYNGAIIHNTLASLHEDESWIKPFNPQNHSGDGVGVSVNNKSKFTMESGSISYNHGAEATDADGGGLMVRAGAIVDIKNGDISFNYVNGYGGGVCLWESDVTILSGNVFNNRATFGGGIALSSKSKVFLGDNQNVVNVHHNKVDINPNKPNDTGFGGGIAVGNDTTLQGENGKLRLVVNNANIFENTAFFGGAISMTTHSNANQANIIQLLGGNIYNNKAKQNNNGNGIYVLQTDSNNPSHVLEFGGHIRVDTSNNIFVSDVQKGQSPIKVTSKLTANGIVGLFDFSAGGTQSSKDSVNFVDFADPSLVQTDKFLLDNSNYHLVNNGKYLQVANSKNQNNIAEAETNSGFVKYTSLTEALTNVKNGGTIKLLRNVSLTENDRLFISGKKVTITSADNNTYSMAISKDFKRPEGANLGVIEIYNGGELILDNIIIDGNSATSQGLSFVVNAGKFTLGANAKLVNNLSTSKGGALTAITGGIDSINNIYGSIEGNKGHSAAIEIEEGAVVNIYSSAVIKGSYSTNYNMNIGINLNSGSTLNIYGNPLIEDVIYHQSGNFNLLKDDRTSVSTDKQFLSNKLDLYIVDALYKANEKIINIDKSAIDTAHSALGYSKLINLVNKQHSSDKFTGFIDKTDSNNLKYYITLDRVIMIKLVFNKQFNDKFDVIGNYDFNYDKINSKAKLKELQTALLRKFNQTPDQEDRVIEELTLHGEDLVIYLHSAGNIDLNVLFEFISKPGYKLEQYVDLSSKDTISSTSSISYPTNDEPRTYGAIWKEITYTFEFYDSDQKNLKTFSYKYETGFEGQVEKQKLPKNEYVKVGYYFVSWKLGNEHFNDLYEINKDFVLKYGSTENNIIRFIANFKSIFDESSGDGSSNNPFKLSTAEHIKTLAYTVNGYGNNGEAASETNPLQFSTQITVNGKPITVTSKYYNQAVAYLPFDYKGYSFVLTGDINSVNTPIGYLDQTVDINDSFLALNLGNSKPFSGEFDGNGHTIDVQLTGTKFEKLNGVALFAYTRNAYIHDLNVKGTVIGNNFVGGMIAMAIGGQYEKLNNSANVQASGSNIGGVFSTIYTPTDEMIKSYVRTVINNGQISYNGPLTTTLQETPKNWNESQQLTSQAGSRVGGVFGQTINIDLNGAYNTGNVTGRYAVGGIVGALAVTNENNTTLSSVTEAFNVGEITATAGILFAYIYDSSNQLKNKTVELVTAYVGGIIGRMYGSGSITKSANDGKVSATYVGKKIKDKTDGWVSEYQFVDINHPETIVDGEYIGARGAGGILGVSSFSKDGGVIHGGNKNIENVYNTGHISAFTAVGGIAGILAYSKVDYAISGGFLTATGFSFKDGQKVNGGTVYETHNGFVRRNYIGGIVGFGINVTLNSNAIFNSDIQTNGVTDSVIKAIGDSEMSLLGFAENNSTGSRKLSSKQLFVGKGNQKPTGLTDTFLDPDWVYLSYETGSANDDRYYYPQLKAFAENSLPINGGSTLGQYSKISVEMVYKDEGGSEQPLVPTKKIIFSYDLNGGILLTDGNSGVVDNNDGSYTYSGIKYSKDKVDLDVLHSELDFQTTQITPLGSEQLYRKGYTFGGWYRDKEFSEKYDFNSISAIDITLYAKWDVITYNINYVGVNSYADGDVKLIGDYRKTYDITDKGQIINLPNNTNFTSRDGSYEFDGFRYVLGDTFYPVDSFKINDNNEVTLLNNGKEVNLPSSHTINLGDLEFKLEAKPKEYTITYELNGGTNHSDNKLTYTIRDQFEFKAPTKEGHEFIGWYSSPDFSGDKVLGINRGQTKNIQLYAKYEVRNYTLFIDKKTGNFEGIDSTGNVDFIIDGKTYHLIKDSTGLYKVEVPFGTNLIDFLNNPAFPKLKGDEGYTFTKWSSNTDIAQDIASTMPSRDYRIFALYQVKTYQITINPQKGLSDFNRVDGAFLDLWKQFEVEKGNLGERIILKKVPYGTNLSEFLSQLQTRINFSQNYHFNGFEPVDFNYYFVKGDNTNLVINLLVAQDEFTWQLFDKDNNFITKITNKTPGFEAKFTEQTLIDYLKGLNNPSHPVNFEIPGYSFEGFSFTNNGSLITDFEINSTQAVFMKYTPKSFNIKFDTQNGDAITGKYEVLFEQRFPTLPNASKKGYTFDYWTYNGKKVDRDTVFTIDNPNNTTEITLVAHYNLITYKIEYTNLMGSLTVIDKTTYNVEEGTVDLSKIKLEVYGYNFKGFKFPGSQDTQIITSFNPLDYTESQVLVLEAVWSPKEIKVTYVAGEGAYFIYNAEDAKYGKFFRGEVEVNQGNADKFVVITTFKGNIYRPQNPVKEGFNFANYEGNTDTSNVSDKTLNAKYTPMKFKVLFDTDGGEAIHTIEVAFGQKILGVKAPTKAGYKFSHWTYNNNRFEIGENGNTVTENMILKAVYTINQWNLTINLEGSGDLTAVKNELERILTGSKFSGNSITKTLDYNSDLSNLNNIHIDGINIMGYFENGNLYTFTKMPDKELTVTLKIGNEATYFIKGQYVELGVTKTITIPFIKQENGSYKLANIQLSIFGYKFNGWYKNQDFTDINKVTFDREYSADELNKLQKNEIIYANLVADKYNITVNLPNGNKISSNYTYGDNKEQINNKLKELINKQSIIGQQFDKFVYTVSNIDFINGDPNSIISGVIDLTAKYNAVVYKVKWHFNNETETKIVDYNYQDEIKIYNYKKEYYLVAWYLRDKNTQEEKLFNIVQMPNLAAPEYSKYVTEEQGSYILNVYAKETPIEYKINLEFNNGSPVKELTFNVNSKNITLTIPTKQHEDFNYYLLGQTHFDKETYTFEELIKYYNNKENPETLTLQAHYSPTNYVLKYNNSNITFTIYDRVVSIKNFEKPTLEGSTFLGFKLSNEDLNTYTDYIEVEKLREIIEKNNVKEIQLVPNFKENEYVILVVDEVGATINPISYQFKYSDKDKTIEELFTKNNYSFVKPGHKFNGNLKTPDPNLTFNLKSKLSEVINCCSNNTITVKPEFVALTYTIVLKDGYNNGTKEITATFNKNVFLKNEFTRTGYTFVNWTDSLGHTYNDNYNAINIITPKGEGERIELTANWKANTFTITLGGNGGISETVVNTISYNYGDITTLTTNTYARVGYIFSGWTFNGKDYTENHSIKEIIDGNNLADNDKLNIVLKAKWTPITYKVEFYANVDTLKPLEQTFTYDVKQNLDLYVPVKYGFEFLGWSSIKGGLQVEFKNGEEVSNLTDQNNGVVKLYGVWEEKKVNITIHIDQDIIIKTIKYGDKIGSLQIPSKKGHEFTGWYMSQTGNDLVNFEQKVEENIDIYARFEAKTYNIIYTEVYDSTNNNPTSHKYGEDVKLTDPVRTGYNFKGWYYASDKNFTNRITTISGTEFDTDKTLVAKWEIQKFNISIKISNVVNSDLERVRKTISDILNSKFGKVDITSSSDETTTNITFKFEVEYLTNLDFLNIIPEEIKYVTDRDKVDSNIVTTYVMDNYRFKENNDYKFGIVTEEINVDTQYKEIKTIYSYTFNYKGKDYKYYKEINKVNGLYTLAERPHFNPVTGYVLGDWKLLGTETNFEFGKGYNNRFDLYVKVSPITYSIIFDGNESDSGSMNQQEFTYDKSQNLSTLGYSKTGHTFKGWSRTKDNQTIDFSDKDVINNLTSNNESITLYAVWEKNQYEVSFENSGNLVNNIKVFYGDNLLTELNKLEFTKRGYKLDHFELNGQRIDELTTMPAENITVKVVYNPITYTIHFDQNGGTGNQMNNLTLTYDKLDQALTKNTYQREGYTFLGWATNKAATTARFADQEIIKENLTDKTEVVTLYAVWQVNVHKVAITINGLAEYDYVESHIRSFLEDRVILKELLIVNNKNSLVITFNADYGTKLNFLNNLLTNYENLNQNGMEYTFDKFDYTFDKMPNNELNVTGKYVVAKYTLTYIYTYKGQKYIDTMLVGNKFDLNTIKVATYKGYVFSGFFNNELYEGSPLTGEIDINQNLTIYAKYDPITYKIKFVDGTKVIGESKDYTYAVLSELPLFASLGYNKPGYTFVGWEYNNRTYTDGNKVMNLTDQNGAILEFKAKFEANTYKINFDTTGGIHIDSIAATYDKIVSLPNAQKTGYRFDGWYLDGVKVENNFIYKYEKDITLVAKYSINELTITFNPNGLPGEVYTQTVNYKEPSKLDPVKFKHTGYTFKGWKTLDSENINYIDEDKILLTESITLYAVFEKDVYEISYNYNGGQTTTSNPTSYSVDTETIILNPLTKTGYEFVGWYDANDIDFRNKVTEIAKGSTGNILLVAKFTVKEFTITYYESNGKDLINTKDLANTYTVESLVEFKPYVKQGYKFISWKLKGTEETITSTYGKATNLELVLVEEKIGYTVIFEANGGNHIKDIIVNYNESIANINDIKTEKYGYNFVGWYLDETLNTKYVNQAITENTTLYAKYETKEITVSFEGLTDTIKVTFGTAYGKLPVTNKEGYTFVGWFDGNNRILESTILVREDNHKLTAKFVIDDYNVYFESNGGSFVNPQNKEFGQKLDQVLAPTREGYKFLGWYKEDNFLNKWNFETDVVEKEMTLYAKWEIINYTITYDYEGINSATNNNPTTYNVESLVEFNRLEETGYRFIGFKYNGKNISSTAGLTGNINVTAVFEVNTYTIHFEGFNNQTIGTIEVKYNQNIPALTRPERVGYNFIKWTYNGNEVKENDIYNFTSDITLKAIYEVITYNITYKGTEGLTNPNSNEFSVENILVFKELSKPGYKFLGFENEATKEIISSTNGIFENITLVAKFEKEQYNVSFVTNTIDKIDSKKVGYNEVIGQIKVLTKTGYRFIGWYSDENFNTPWDLESNKVTKDLVLYAKFEANTYDIVFVDGTKEERQTVTYDTLTNLRANSFEKLGYKFIGWSKENNNTVAYRDQEAISNFVSEGEIKLYACYEIIKYKITYINDDKVNTVSEYTIETEDIHVVKPQRTGYKFKGFNDGNKLVVDYIIKKGTTGDITLTAEFEANKYNIIFVNGELTTTQEVTYDVLTKLNLNTFEKRGYAFIGWSVENDNSVDYGNGETINNLVSEGEIKLYACWKVETYHIEYVDGYNKLNSTTYTIEKEVVFKDPSKLGYEFKGWFLNDKQITSTKDLVGDLRLIAKWNVLTYQITYEDELNAENNNPRTYTIEDHIILNNLQKEGYNFVGWYLDGRLITDIKGTTGNITLVAKWEIKQYTVKFDTDSSSRIDDITVKHGNTVSYVKSPVKSGYKFIGWFVSTDSSETLINLNDYVVTKDITLKAKYETITYHITYKDELNAVNNNQKTYTILDNVVLESLAKEGYKFLGWYNQDGRLITEIAKGTTGNITLEAKWEINKYTVKFDTDSLSKIEDKIVEYGSLITDITNPVKEGYKFLGWFVSTDKDETLIDLSKYVVVDNVTLKAKYEIVKYTITYNDELNSTNQNPTTYTILDNIELKGLSKEGYKFIGWYLNGKLVTEIAKGTTGNITLEAKWEINKYTVKFDTDSLSKIEDKLIEHGSLITDLTSPVKEGYKFLGWFVITDENKNLIDLNNFKVTKDITLKAKYEIVNYTVTYIDENGEEIKDIENNKFNINAPLTFDSYEKIGYKFIGWYLEDNKILDTKGIYENITVKAKFEIIEYSITYVGYENLDLPSKYTVINKVVFSPVSKLGHKFIGWYLDGQKVESTEGFTKDLALEARFEINTYKITFKDGNNVVDEINVNHGLGMTNKVLESNENRVFMGWVLDGKDFDITTPITKDITLVAKWGLLTLEHKVEGADGLVVSIKSNKGFAEGTKVNFEIITNEVDLTNASNAVKELGRLKVLYDISLSDEAGNEVTLEDNVSITFKAPGKKYYEIYKVFYVSDDYSTFEEFTYLEQDGNLTFTTNHFSLYGVVVYDGPKNFSWLWILIVSLITLGFTVTVIVLVKNRKYTIKYVTNSDDQLKSDHYKPDQIVTLPTPDKPGYVFVGWYYDNSFLKPALFSVMPKSALTLFAKWKPVELIDEDYIPVAEDDENVEMKDLNPEIEEEFYIPVPEDDELVDVRVENVSFEVIQPEVTVEKENVDSHFNDYSIDMEQLIKDTDDSSK